MADKDSLTKESARGKIPRAMDSTGTNSATLSPLFSRPMFALQRAVGNRAVGKLLSTSVQQSGLGIGPPDDEYEQEAERVADRVMTMPSPQLQRQKEEEKEEIVQPAGQIGIRRQKIPTAGPTTATPELTASITSLTGGGQPLPAESLNFFGARFGKDFSQVRIQRDGKADTLAAELNARAFTLDQTIFFRSNQYQPETSRGKRLLAHELTHVLQQSQAPAARLQRHCGGPEGQFDLAGSQIGQRIAAGLNTITETMPSERPGGQPTSRPRISPAAVLTLVAISPCFLHDAQQVEWTYFGRPRQGGGTSAPRLSPPLSFDFHEAPARGTQFSRGEAQIRVHATTMADVVQSIVHEIAHASHAPPGPRGEGGAVTRQEQGAVREEARTRVRENELMGQIVASPLWRQYTGQSEFPRAQEGESDVRASFRSGLPMLTYQEYFIVEQKLNSSRPSGINEVLTRDVVLTLYDPMHRVNRENAGRFRIGTDDIERYQRQGALPLPVAPPTLAAAVECARIFRAHPEWRRTVQRSNRLPEAVRQRFGPACSAFIEGYPQPTSYPLNQAYGGQWINEPGDEFARRGFFIQLHSLMRSAYDAAVGVRDTGRLVDRWFQSLPETSRNQGREYLEWLLITETMSREWISLGRPTPDPQRRRQHLDFLQTRIGRPLRGISREGL